MITDRSLIAIGRSRYLFDGINYLVSKGYKFKAIITGEAYYEYDIKSHDFRILAEEIGAEFFISNTLLSNDIVNLIKDNNIQLAISANWKFRIPKKILDLFGMGILNFHLGNLPDYKGNATVNWSIINGENSIYANVHKMDPELDAGDIVSRRAIPITSDTYISNILEVAAGYAPLLYEDALEKVINDPKSFEVAGTTDGLRCFPRAPEDSQINWNYRSDEVSRLVRASSRPYRGAFTFLEGERVIIWKARPFSSRNKICAVPGHIVGHGVNDSVLVACREGILEIEEIEYKEVILPPGALITSIRQRFKYNEDV